MFNKHDDAPREPCLRTACFLARARAAIIGAVERVRLFVYGTLKRGFARADLMAGAVFEGTAMTQSGYAIHDLGEYPALVASDDGVVSGEVYSVTPEHLEALDRYEGCPELYVRQSIALADGLPAEAYFINDPGVSGCPRIEAGEWQPGRGAKQERPR